MTFPPLDEMEAAPLNPLPGIGRANEQKRRSFGLGVSQDAEPPLPQPLQSPPELPTPASRALGATQVEQHGKSEPASMERQRPLRAPTKRKARPADLVVSGSASIERGGSVSAQSHGRESSTNGPEMEAGVSRRQVRPALRSSNGVDTAVWPSSFEARQRLQLPSASGTSPQQPQSKSSWQASLAPCWSWAACVTASVPPAAKLAIFLLLLLFLMAVLGFDLVTSLVAAASMTLRKCLENIATQTLGLVSSSYHTAVQAASTMLLDTSTLVGALVEMSDSVLFSIFEFSRIRLVYRSALRLTWKVMFPLLFAGAVFRQPYTPIGNEALVKCSTHFGQSIGGLAAAFERTTHEGSAFHLGLQAMSAKFSVGELEHDLASVVQTVNMQNMLAFGRLNGLLYAINMQDREASECEWVGDCGSTLHHVRSSWKWALIFWEWRSSLGLLSTRAKQSRAGLRSRCRHLHDSQKTLKGIAGLLDAALDIDIEEKQSSLDEALTANNGVLNRLCKFSRWGCWKPGLDAQVYKLIHATRTRREEVQDLRGKVEAVQATLAALVEHVEQLTYHVELVRTLSRRGWTEFLVGDSALLRTKLFSVLEALAGFHKGIQPPDDRCGKEKFELGRSWLHQT